MENIKHVGIVVHRMDDLWQATRTALGLALGNYYAYLFLLDAPVEMDDKLKENLELMEEMECEYYSNRPDNEPHTFRYLSTDNIAKKLKAMDIVIPFGNRIAAPPGQLPILWMLTSDA
jgi:hypothetical protein